MENNNPGCLGVILKLLGVKFNENVGNRFPYAKRDDFLSPAEFSFYKVLMQGVPENVVICPKVSLKDIFFVTTNDRKLQNIYFNKISKKHIDFLLCSRSTMKPICGIELDDSSHNKQKRIERDLFVNQVFKEANLQLVRFKNKRSYTLSEVKEQLQSLYLMPPPLCDSHSDGVPICPKCKTPLVLRTVKNGENKGNKFYGCVNYPKCRELQTLS